MSAYTIRKHLQTTFTAIVLLITVLLLQGCGHRTNSAVTEHGRHKITIIPSPGLIITEAGLEERDGVARYRHHYLVGSKIDVVIDHGELTVNGSPYGKLNVGDSVSYECDSGRVRINGTEVKELASN